MLGRAIAAHMLPIAKDCNAIAPTRSIDTGKASPCELLPRCSFVDIFGFTLRAFSPGSPVRSPARLRRGVGSGMH